MKFAASRWGVILAQVWNTACSPGDSLMQVFFSRLVEPPVPPQKCHLCTRTGRFAGAEGCGTGLDWFAQGLGLHCHAGSCTTARHECSRMTPLNPLTEASYNRGCDISPLILSLSL